MSRREMLVLGAASAAAGSLARPAVALPAGGKMPTRRLGRTGVDVSLVGLGGYHLGTGDERNAIRIVRTAIDHGLTFMDNCWDYNDGKSHAWMGKALRDGYRKRAFLMTKIDGRNKVAAAAQIDQSLRALETDVIDLMQVHEVIRAAEPERVFGPGGAMEALVAARKAGKIRFIGFTGHKSPDIHLAMLDVAAKNGFRFDAVQLPLNVMDAHYESFERRVLPRLVKDDIAVLGMKPLGSGLFLKSKPLTSGAVTPADRLRYTMALETSVTITGCDRPEILMQAIDAAYRYRPFDQKERKALLVRTAPAAARGAWEKYKTSGDFDGTARNPHWLETDSLRG